MPGDDASRRVEQALADVRVLEWGQGVAARYAAGCWPISALR
jgi:hypothetical protein